MDIMSWIDSSGNIYEGQYIMIDDNLILDGVGTIIFNQGYKLKGNFMKGMKHCIFKLTDLNKKVYEPILVIFDNDILRTDDDNNVLVYTWKKL